MEKLRQHILDNLIQLQDIVSMIGKPNGTDYSNMFKFSPEANILEKLSILTTLATTQEQLDVIFLIVADVTTSIKTKYTDKGDPFGKIN